MEEAKPSKIHILVLTAPVGGGHVATARVLAETLAERSPAHVEVKLVDVMEKASDLIQVDKMASSTYQAATQYLKSYPYKLFYDFADSKAKLVNRFFTAVFRDAAVQLLEDYRPDVVVSTFPIISYAATRVIRERSPKHIPVISIVTDAGDVQRLWLMGVEDAILVATPETKDYAVAHGVEASRLQYLGFPVSKAYTRLLGKSQARKELGLADMPTVLLTCGGLGLSPGKFFKVAKEFARQKLDYQLVFVCGRNQALATRVAKLKFSGPSVVYGYANNQPMLVAACDIIVGKAGWITLAEAITARRPTVIFDVIPGQEEPNAAFMERHKVGVVAEQPEMVPGIVTDYLEDELAMRRYEKAVERLGFDGSAAARIADFIIAQVEPAPKPAKI